MNKSRIIILTSAHRHPDPRIFYKQAVSLAKHFEVCLYTQSDEKSGKYQNVNITALSASRTLPARIRRVFQLFWVGLTVRGDLVLFHDPELVIPMVIVKVLTDRKIIWDIHEDYGKVAYSRIWIPLGLRNLIACFIRYIEKISAYFFDGFMVVIDSFIKKVGKKPFEVIYNYPRIEGIQLQRRDNKILGLLYVGDITENRGAFRLLKLAIALLNKNCDFKMYLIGPVPHNYIRKRVDDVINKHKLENQVIKLGQLSLQDINKYARRCQFGLIPNIEDERYEESLPTKMFEYMMFGLTVISSRIDRWSKIIEKNNCGFTVDWENISSIADRVINQFETKLFKRFGSNGKKVVKNYYSWEMEEMKLLNFFNSLIGDNYKTNYS